MLRGREAVRADRRLRTDEKAIRAQSAILNKNNPKPFLPLTTTGFWYGCFLSVPKPGSRAPRASPLASCDSIYDTVNSSPFFERRALVQFVQIAIDPGCLALKELLHRAREFGMLQPVRGNRLHGQKTA